MAKARERDGVFQRKDRAGWWISYMEGDRRRKRKVEAQTRQQALDALRRLKTKEETARALGVRAESDITTGDLFKRFKTYQKPRISKTTFARLDGILDTLLAHLPAQAKQITRAAVNDFVDTRAAQVSPGTIAKELATLSKCLRLAVDEWGLLNRNAAHGVKAPKQPEGRTRYLTPGELKAALEAAPEWMRAPMALAASTGCRRGEILGLRWMDVDFAKRLLYLRETKNGTLRILRLNQPAMQVLGSLPQGSAGDLLFPDVDSQRLSVYTRRIFARLGIEDASFHSLRHTFASLAVMEGADLYAVGQILGHKTPRMTQRYAHLSPAYQAATAGKLDTVMGGIWPHAAASRTLAAGESKPAAVSPRRVPGKQ